MPRRTAGLTMIELMVTASVLGVVMIYVMQTFTVQHRTYEVLDQVVDAQQSIRVIGDLLERDLRHAGFMVPAGATSTPMEPRATSAGSPS